MPVEAPSPILDRPAPCPRCGYDQRGIAAMWADACPLEGTCPECGLVFDWSEVLRPERHRPFWCVEFEPATRRVPLAAAKTLWRSLWPWGFWKRLTMAQPVRPRRLMAYLACLVLPLVVGAVVMQASVAVYVRAQVASGLKVDEAALTDEVEFLKALVDGAPLSVINERGRRLDYFMVDHFQRLSAQEQRQLLASQQQTLAVIQQRQLQFSYGEAVAEALLRPFAETSDGVITTPWGTESYPPPRLLYYFVFRTANAAETLLLSLLSVATLLVGCVLLPTGLALLPVSRRRAKVRWAHVMRVGMYSAWIPFVMPFVLLALAMFLLWTDGQAAPPGMFAAIGWACLGGWLALVVWWAVAIKRYLRMPHGAAVALLLAVLSFLILATGVFLIQQAQ